MRTWPWALIVFCLSVSLLTGCGGGGGGGASQPTRLTAPTGGGGGSAVSAPSTINGTAASGAALAGATVTARDATGKTVAVTTDAGGNFFIDTTGLTLPLLIRAEDGVHPPLFSIAFANGTANVTPLTNLVLSLYYAANGTTPMAAFAATPPVLPTPDRLAVIQSLIQQQIEQALTAAGLDPNRFNLFRTPFSANHQGIDGILDNLTVGSSGSNSTVTLNGNGFTTNSNISVNGVSGTVTVNNTTTSDGSGDSTNSSQTTILPPAGSPAAMALQSASDLLNQVIQTVNARGPSLAAADLDPYLTADYLNDGEDHDRSLARLATEFRGIAVQGFQVLNVPALDLDHHLLTVDVAFMEGGPGGPRPPQPERLVFQDDGSGHWLLYGNQRVAAVDVIPAVKIVLDDDTGPQVTRQLVYRAVAPQGQDVQQVVADSTNTLSLFDAGLPVHLLPDGPDASPLEFLDNVFELDTDQAVPPLDHVYDFQVTANGQVYHYQQHLHAFSTEGTNVEVDYNGAPDPGHGLGDAHFDQPLTMRWTLPITFPVVDVQVYGVVKDSNGQVKQVYPAGPSFISEDGSVNPAAGSAQIVLPSTVLSSTDATAQADVFVSMRGLEGESIGVDSPYLPAQQPPP